MITGPFLNLTFLCIGILCLGAVSVFILASMAGYTTIKRKRVTSSKAQGKK